MLINTRPTLTGFNMNEQQRGSSAFERSSDCTGISKTQHVESERRPSWRGRGSESPALRRQSSSRTRSFVRAPEHKQWWKFTLRPWDDDQEQDWWFAGTAIPLLAATIGMCKRVDSGQCTASLVLAASYHGVEGGMRVVRDSAAFLSHT